MRKLFIGSSSEGLPFARHLKQILDKQLSDFLECTIWADGKVFTSNKSTLESLMVAVRKFDYGVLVATKDDIVTIRQKEHFIPRDNVMFEMGMFLGSLGLTRAFLMVEKESKLPTDYNGVTVSYFEREVDGSLAASIADIISVIEVSSKSFNLRPVPSAALALSYFDNFVQPLAKKMLNDDVDFTLKILLPQNISDIDTTRIAYRRTHPSDEASVYEKGSRPIVFKLKDEENAYWDIPTTLSTLNKLIDMVSPSKEIGEDPEKQDWIAHELRQFKGTVEVLINRCDACLGNVSLLYMQ